MQTGDKRAIENETKTNRLDLTRQGKGCWEKRGHGECDYRRHSERGTQDKRYRRIESGTFNKIMECQKEELKRQRYTDTRRRTDAVSHKTRDVKTMTPRRRQWDIKSDDSVFNTVRPIVDCRILTIDLQRTNKRSWRAYQVGLTGDAANLWAASCVQGETCRGCLRRRIFGAHSKDLHVFQQLPIIIIIVVVIITVISPAPAQWTVSAESAQEEPFPLIYACLGTQQCSVMYDPRSWTESDR